MRIKNDPYYTNLDGQGGTSLGDQAQRLQKEQSGNAAERALMMMMDGKLDIEDESVSEFDIPPPTCYNKEESELTDAEIKEIKDTWKKQNSLVVKAGGLHIIGTERHFCFLRVRYPRLHNRESGY